MLHQHCVGFFSNLKEANKSRDTASVRANLIKPIVGDFIPAPSIPPVFPLAWQMNLILADVQLRMRYCRQQQQHPSLNKKQGKSCAGFPCLVFCLCRRTKIRSEF